MKKQESKFYQELKKAWPNVHFQRIETTTGLGIPDVNCCVNGVEFWLELKVSLGKRLAITKYQKSWIPEAEMKPSWKGKSIKHRS